MSFISSAMHQTVGACPPAADSRKAAHFVPADKQECLVTPALRCTRILCHWAFDSSPDRQQLRTSVHLSPRCAAQRGPNPAFQLCTVAGRATCSAQLFARGCLLGRVPAAHFCHRLLIDMANTLMASGSRDRNRRGYGIVHSLRERRRH
jgi:hypothetical protein